MSSKINSSKINSSTEPSQTSVGQDVYVAQVVKFYEEIAEHYDAVYGDHVRDSSESMRIVRQVLLEKEVSPKKILDVGCGTGWDIIDLHENSWGCEYYGFDLSQAMIEKSRTNLKMRGITANLWVGNVSDDNFQYEGQDLTSQFDVVMFRGNSLGHLHYNEYKTAFSNIINVLKPGGIFMFDFRDGHEQFGKRLPVEVRDTGYNSQSEVFYVSAYLQKHSPVIREPYHFLATLVTWKGGTDKPKLTEYSIQAHYVLPEEVFTALAVTGFGSQDEITERVGESLPYLRSFMAMKG